MSFYYSPRIITSGLVLYLDAANTKSYPGSGTTWSDLSRSGTNGTLVNGPTFNSSNGGSIVFDGTNDYGIVSSLNLSNTNKITIEIWMRFTTTSLNIITEYSTNVNINNNTFYIDISEFGGTGTFNFADKGGTDAYNISYTSAGFNDGKWHCFTVVCDRSLSNLEQNKIYADSVLNTILHPVYRANLNDNYSNYSLYIASRAGSSFFYNGNIGIFKIYNRALSATEVLQNYNATKTRFGL